MKNKKNGKIVAAIQARMGSSRLPGKPLMSLNGKPMLEYIMKRLSKSRYIDLVCVATTKNPKDDELVEYLDKKKIPYFRGAENDIVSRLYQTAQKFSAKGLVRVWGDCPLIDPFVIDEMIEKYLYSEADFATNTMPPSYPFGMNAEIYRYEGLKEIFVNANSPFYREFPFAYIKDSDRFKTINTMYPKDVSHVHLTVDYPQDVEVMTGLIKELSKEKQFFGVDEIIRYYERNRRKFNKNKGLERNIEYKQKLKFKKDHYRKIKDMGILVIGCGSIGQRHIKNLISIKAGEILAYDIDPRKLKEVRKISPSIVASDKLKDLWAMKPQIVFIATPTSLHAKYALQAAKQGCHLFIEKPLSHTPEGLNKLIDVVNKKKLITFVGYNFRFNDYIRKIKRLLDDKTIGKVISGTTDSGSYLPERHPWEDYRFGYGARKALGGGVILDRLSHHLDYWMFLLGKPKEVFCSSGKRSSLDVDVEDTVDALIKYSGGEIINLHADFIQRPAKHTLEIIGEKGTVSCDLVNNSFKYYDLEKRKWISHRGAKDNNIFYIRELKYFLGCVKNNILPAVDVTRGKETLDILMKLKESSRTRKWVKI